MAGRAGCPVRSSTARRGPPGSLMEPSRRWRPVDQNPDGVIEVGVPDVHRHHGPSGLKDEFVAEGDIEMARLNAFEEAPEELRPVRAGRNITEEVLPDDLGWIEPCKATFRGVVEQDRSLLVDLDHSEG